MHTGIFPPRNFKAVDELRRQVTNRFCIQSCNYASRAAVPYTKLSQQWAWQRNLTTDSCLQIQLYLEHQLEACTQPDPEAPNAPFRVRAVPVHSMTAISMHLLKYRNVTSTCNSTSTNTK